MFLSNSMLAKLKILIIRLVNKTVNRGQVNQVKKKDQKMEVINNKNQYQHKIVSQYQKKIIQAKDLLI